MTVTVIAHIVAGEIHPTYHVIGEDVRLFIVDDNCHSDRVYEWLRRSPPEVIEEIIPEGSSVGNNQDDRHPALVNSVNALLDGVPRLQLVKD